LYIIQAKKRPTVILYGNIRYIGFEFIKIVKAKRLIKATIFLLAKDEISRLKNYKITGK